MARTPQFLVTDAGLAAAMQATPPAGSTPGVYIEIDAWKVGSAFGYEPQRTDTTLNGSTLAEGQPLAYTYVGDNTINIICRIAAEEGPFDFGEVALYLKDGTMFAKAVFDAPQTKYSSLGSNVGSTYTFNCLLKLEQSVALFQVSTASGIPPDVYTVEKWSDVFPPSLMPDPLVPIIRVNEPNSRGEPTLITQLNDQWYVSGQSYLAYGNRGFTSITYPVVNATTTYVDIAASQLRSWDAIGGVNRKFLLRTADGFFRSVSSVTVNGANYRFSLNADPLPAVPTVGSQIRLYRDDATSNARIYYDQIIDPPALPLASQSTAGMAQAGATIRVAPAGVFNVDGLVKDTSLTTVGNADSVWGRNGIFMVTGGGPGYGYGLVQSMNYSEVGGNFYRVQIYYPIDATNQPPFWRAGLGNGGATAWAPLVSGGRVGANLNFYAELEHYAGSNSYNISNARAPGVMTVGVNDEPGGSGATQMTLNGGLVSKNTKFGSSGYGRQNHDTALFRTGDNVSWAKTWGGFGDSFCQIIYFRANLS